MNVQGHVAPREVHAASPLFYIDVCFDFLLLLHLCHINLKLLLLFFFFFVLPQKHPGSLAEGFSQTQVSTLAVKDKLLVAGGFQGELICKVILPLLYLHIYTYCV